MNLFKKVCKFAIFFLAIGLISSLICINSYAKDADGDYVIVLDPGHGSADPGASSILGDSEEPLNWNIAVALKAELETYEGVKVYLTRGSAEPFSNTGRASLCLTVGADYGVSMHNNSAGPTSKGVLCLAASNKLVYDKSYGMCVAIANEVKTLVGYSGVSASHNYLNDGLSPVSSYTFIDECGIFGVPALIVENVYLSNPDNANFIHSKANQDKLGYANATGIAKYLGLKKRTVQAGNSISLIRTYSAQFAGATGTFSTSNEAVAHVSSSGLITATGTGTATINCTQADGTTISVTVNVPEVKMIGINAGITPTMFHSLEEVSSYINTYWNSRMIVKAVYSDGTSKQVSGATIGKSTSSHCLTYINTNDGSLEPKEAYDTEVFYNGFKTLLRTYYGPKLYVGTYSPTNVYLKGTNTDILHFPTGSYSSTAGNAGTVIPPAPTQSQVTVPTQQATSATTAESTTEHTTESTTEMSSASSSEASTEATTVTTQGTTATVDNANSNNYIIPILIALIVLVGILLGIATFIALRKK